MGRIGDMKKEIITSFQGRNNVIHIVTDTSSSYITQGVSFVSEAESLGGIKLNTVETDTKHVMFLFDSNDKEVKRYYLGKKLQGKTPQWLVENRQYLTVFESFNPETKIWVPCVSLSNEYYIAKQAVSIVNQDPPFPPNNTPKPEYTEEMFQQEIAEQEEKDLLEYGTTDQNEINKIKKDKKDNRNFWVFVIVLGLVAYMIMGGIAKCSGSKFDPFNDDDTEWQYRHTDRIK